MNRPARPVELPVVVGVRFTLADVQRLTALATASRRTLSQTVRLLLEDALREDTDP